MASAFNQYSLLLMVIGILAVAAFFLFQKRAPPSRDYRFFSDLCRSVCCLACSASYTNSIVIRSNRGPVADRSRQTSAA